MHAQLPLPAQTMSHLSASIVLPLSPLPIMVCRKTGKMVHCERVLSQWIKATACKEKQNNGFVHLSLSSCSVLEQGVALYDVHIHSIKQIYLCSLEHCLFVNVVLFSFVKT